MSAAHAAPALPGPLGARAEANRGARAVTFGALCAFALLTWGRLVDPGWTLGALAASACAMAVTLVTPHSRLGRVATAAGLSVAALVLAGVPPRLLFPNRWADLAAGVSDGIGSLSSLTVPYNGGDVWARRTLLLIGIAFVGVAAIASRPRRGGRAARSPLVAGIALAALYAVAVIQVEPAHPALSGAVLALLLTPFLWVDRVPAGMAPTAAILVGVTIFVGMVAAPVLNRPAPWFDYQRLTSDYAAAHTVTYDWDHDYGPLTWPRRGREVLRVSTTKPSYWKAAVLDGFDGREWRRAGGVASFEPASDRRMSSSGWTRRISVNVRDLSTPEFAGAGETLGIQRNAVPAVAQAGGFFVTDGRELERGDTYTAIVYTPRPSVRQLQDAGDNYPSFARLWLRVDLPNPPVHRTPQDVGVPVEAQFAPFGRSDSTLVSFRGGQSGIVATADPDAIVLGSGLGRVYALAQQLKRTARSPYAFVRAVQARVRRGATYTETPPRSATPLEDFLFRTHRGYCQQFSGAMALLLRMGGVPARVAVGFSPGTYDREHHRYSVRDLDAHSWVEAYFPRLGWITLDPTPAASPARDQIADLATGGRVRPSVLRAGGGDLPENTGAAAASGGHSGTGTRRAIIVLALAALALVALAVAGRRRRPVRPDEVPELAELERALRRTGRPPAPGATLSDLRRTLGDCGGYLDALIRQRFAPPGGAGPTTRERRALRRALGDGLGPAGAVRSWWAVPPRPFTRDRRSERGKGDRAR